ncbi:MAG TPA: helix-turn-helix transcriptional regulator [Dehalococcoidia bacterium]|nr:helix-turn-helix transcriptional regulator [Dehalococcoidia bacterium]
MLRSLRESAALSQLQLAEQAGVSAVTIVRLETGMHAPRGSTIQKLAAALSVLPRELFREESKG